MKIIITGGAGYIGSHVVKQLIECSNYEITIIDSLVTGFEQTVKHLQKLDKKIKFIKCDLGTYADVARIFQENHYDVVLHFAASLVVSESVTNPLKYYLNNTANTTNLVNCCINNGVNKFIFSSTAAVYGEQEYFPGHKVSENVHLSPVNPYGFSKMFSEKIIKDTAAAYPFFKYIILRYFNVAGADTDGILGQITKNATHLIKVAAQTAVGKRDKIQVFGTDYDTFDGTCIRDFIHVDDLASAHICAMRYLDDHPSNVFNCGYGRGYSVKEVIMNMQKISKNNFNVEYVGRRDGDVSQLISDNSKLINLTNWIPKYDSIEHICRTTLDWEKRI